MEAHPAEAWGVAPGFHDVAGEWRTAGGPTLAAILAAMGAGDGPPPDPDALPRFVREGEAAAVAEPELETEDGARVSLRGNLPADLPIGYHTLVAAGGSRRALVVAPARCHLPADLFGWGFATQLYSLHSARSQGLGDLADLAQLGRWASGLGARFVLLNPLHAALPGLPQEPSPYYPSSRLHLNPLYLRVDGLPARAPAGTLDRDAAYTAKLKALEARWRRVRGRVGDELAALQRRLPDLETYGRFCALAEVHGRPWRSWPAELRHPDSPAVVRFAGERRDRVDFHHWLQLELERQLREAAATVPLVGDLAVGVHPDGYDAWLWQDVLAAGVSVGAPPDPFNAAGQDWGLPPFDPWRLAAAGFLPWRQTLRAAFRHAAGLRIDHVMGLFRLYWIPAGMGPAGGAYVRYPSRELLDVLAIESRRAGAFVVGEDLGTVQPEVRRALRERDILSYRLLWFEPGPPSGYPEAAMAALTTHDLPTLLGVWSGSDPMPEVRARLLRDGGLAEDAPAAAVLEAAHRLLATSPSRLLAVTLEDLAGARARPNRPGTTEPTNWSRPLPLSLEELERSPQAALIAEVMQRRKLE